MNVACPTCKKKVEWSERSAWRPFCSERCQLIDLGAWFNEEHRIPDRSGAKSFETPDTDQDD